MSLQTIQVELQPRTRSYDVVIGQGALSAAARQLAALCPRNLLWVITDETVADLHLRQLEDTLADQSIEMRTLILPVGESQKSFTGLERVCNFLLAEGIERNETVAAFGGGVIGDLTGFASAITKRGLGFVQIPTTLLAQIDSSVGGKTAINTIAGKNMAGAFHQPKLVIANVGFLQTLDARQWRAGYAEMLKMACLWDGKFFDFLEQSGPEMQTGNLKLLTNALAISVQNKADIVAEDELEKGRRALLNLGHTFGHALEAEAMGKILHGEAVAAGMSAAFSLSADIGFCSAVDGQRVRQHLTKMGLPASLGEAPGGPYQSERLLQRMQADKKNALGKIHLVLCRKIGETLIHHELGDTQILKFLRNELGA